jgi:hypothetical protein
MLDVFRGPVLANLNAQVESEEGPMHVKVLSQALQVLLLSTQIGAKCSEADTEMMSLFSQVSFFL